MVDIPSPYPAYKPSGIPWLGDVPAHWEARRLKTVCRFAYGDTLTAGMRVKGSVPVYGSNGRIGMHSEPNTKSPCIIVGRKGSFGKVHFVDEPAFAIDTTYFIDVRYSKANLKWLYYVLESVKLDDVTKDSAIPGLGREDAYQRVLPLPPLTEQRAIVQYLDRADDRIRRCLDANRRLVALLEEERQAAINQAVTRGLDADAPLKPSGIQWLGDVPAHWEVRRLKTLCRMKSGDGITAESIEPTGKYPVYGGNGIRGYTSGYTHDGDYALIGRQGALCGNIHIARGRFWASEHAVVATLEKPCETVWFAAILDVMNLNQYSISAAQPGLSVERILNLALPVPPSHEQLKISEYLDAAAADIDAKIARARRLIELLEEYRTRLIADVVTGKLDVRDAAQSQSPGAVDGADGLCGMM